MTETRQTEQVRGALGGVVIALAVMIAIFAFYALAQAATPGESGAVAIHNGAEYAVGL